MEPISRNRSLPIFTFLLKPFPFQSFTPIGRIVRFSFSKKHSVLARKIVVQRARHSEELKLFPFGQARRVSLARAIALEPKLIIADEPTAGLDVSIQGEILNLIAELQDKTSVSIMLITHNLNVVRHISDRVAIMYMGDFLEIDKTETIFANPTHDYTRKLIAANAHPKF